MADSPNTLPLFIALCLRCKENSTGTDWEEDVALWVEAHAGIPGHTVAVTKSSVHVDFTTKTTPPEKFGRSADLETDDRFPTLGGGHG